MKQIEKLSENTNYSAVNMGELDDLMDYSLIHPVNKKLIEGKVFLKDMTKQPARKYHLTHFLQKRNNPIFIYTGKTKKRISF